MVACDGGSDWGSNGPHIRGFSAVCATMWRSRLGPSASGDCVDSGRRKPERCGEVSRGHAADRSGLGAALQRGRTRWSGDPQSTRARIYPERRAACSSGRGRRDRPDPRGARGGALAACRSCPVGMGRVLGIDHTSHAGSRASGYGLSQALGAAASSWAEGR